MKINSLTIEEAKSKGCKQPYAFLKYLDRLTVGPTPADFSPEELLEASLFSEKEEIRIFQSEEGKLTAVEIIPEESDEPIKRTYRIQNQEFGSELTVQSIIGYDEDGQANIVATRLYGWKEKNK